MESNKRKNELIKNHGDAYLINKNRKKLHIDGY